MPSDPVYYLGSKKDFRLSESEKGVRVSSFTDRCVRAGETPIRRKTGFFAGVKGVLSSLFSYKVTEEDKKVAARWERDGKAPDQRVANNGSRR